MPWKHNGRTLKEGREWVDDSGNQHSKVWMRYSDSQKATFKIVWEDPPASEAPYDNRFYSGRKTDGTLIPRSLTDINEVDEDAYTGLTPITNREYEENEQDKKRQIKLLDDRYLGAFITEFKELMEESVI